jgi:hypothetical protein
MGASRVKPSSMVVIKGMLGTTVVAGKAVVALLGWIHPAALPGNWF